MGTAGEIEKAVIFFDGVCNLCNSSVNFVIDHDTKGSFHFASLQSDYAQAILARYGVNPEKLDSIVLVQSGTLYQKSDAALEIARHLSGGWSWLYGFKIVPRFIRNHVYDWIAINRYRWFGRTDACRVPTSELRQRFIDS